VNGVYLEEKPKLDEGPFLKEERNLINSIATNIETFLARKYAEQSLQTALDSAERANNTKSEFLASMSHELRTPLNAIIGFAQMMQFDPKTPLSGSQNEHIDFILEGGNHLLELVNSILDLGRIEAGRVSLSLENVDARDVIQRCVGLVSSQSKSQKITIENSIGEKPLPYLRTDQTRMKQILLNLLSNAIKFNKKDGNVIIEAKETDDDFLHISVKDTGIGLSEESQSKIFDLYHRLEEDAHKAKDGTGIGLTVSKLLVEQMGGRIGMSSKENIGSTFWIELPLASNENVLIWSEAMRVGIDAVDKDHQVLISLLNKLTGRSVEELEINQVIDELIDYTHYHFNREETIMEACLYPDIKRHQDIHRTLALEVKDLANNWHKNRDPKLLSQLHRFLSDWLFDHILNEDTKISSYANGKREEIRIALENLN
jgi:hemerythrin-like metal-binding protein